MTRTLAEAYAKQRAEGIPASQAVLIARGETKPRTDALDWQTKRNGTEQATWEQDGFTLIARQVVDEDADLDFYGDLTHDRATGRDVFTPAYDYYADVKGRMGKAAAREYARERERIDRQRIEDYGNGWNMVGVVVTAYREGIELGSASLWGIESDSGADYFDEVARENADEAIIEARKALARICTCDHGRTVEHSPEAPE